MFLDLVHTKGGGGGVWGGLLARHVYRDCGMMPRENTMALGNLPELYNFFNPMRGVAIVPSNKKHPRIELCTAVL